MQLYKAAYRMKEKRKPLSNPKQQQQQQQQQLPRDMKQSNMGPERGALEFVERRAPQLPSLYSDMFVSSITHQTQSSLFKVTNHLGTIIPFNYTAYHM